MAIQIIGVNKLMSADLDYRSEDAYEVLCKVAAINVAYNCSIFSPSQRACLNSLLHPGVLFTEFDSYQIIH